MGAQIEAGVFLPVKGYSAELRNLVALMLQVQPVKRPSMNQILAMPFMQQHIRTCLAQSGYALSAAAPLHLIGSARIAPPCSSSSAPDQPDQLRGVMACMQQALHVPGPEQACFPSMQ